MSREIKFKIWFNGKMCVPGDSTIKEIYFDGGPWNEKTDGTLLQYTGLKDKTGKEIYDGDVVKVDRCRVVDGELVETGIETGNVFWADYFYQYRVSFDHIRYDDYEALMDNDDRYEVIGNIYENPELIKYEL